MKKIITYSMFILLIATIVFATNKYEFSFQQSIGSFGSSKGLFNTPKGIAGDGESLFICDRQNNRIVKYDIQTKTFDIFSELPEDLEQLDNPADIILYQGSSVLVSDTNNNRLVHFSYDGEFQSAFGELGLGKGEFDEPLGLSFSKSGEILVADSANNRVQVFRNEVLYKNASDSAGDYVSLEFNQQELDEPLDVLVTRKGDVLVTDAEGVKKFDSFGNLLKPLFEDIEVSMNTQTVFEDDAGDYYVIDAYKDQVIYIDQNHKVLGVIKEKLQKPVDVFVKKDLVYITDAKQHKILVYKKI